MRFANGSEMLKETEWKDLYNPVTQQYVFGYNGCGSIAVYYITNEEAEKLKQETTDTGFYWGAILGPGGRIYDDPSYERFKEGDYSNLDWCNDNYEGEWEDVSPKEVIA